MTLSFPFSALAALAAAPLSAAAADCSGEAPHWCASWEQPNEPFYNCSGSSELAPEQCGAWQELFDQNGGSGWLDCSDARSDPCACHGKAHGHHGKGAIVFCKDGHIESIDMMGNRVNGTLTDALSKMSGLLLLNLGINQLVGPVPKFPDTLTELYIGGNKNPAGRHGFEGGIPDLSYMTELHSLDMALNKLNGTIPASIGSLSKLRVLYLYNNHLSGKIPPLDFERYSYCGIGNGGPAESRRGENHNRWCTPLPPGAKSCSEEGGVCADDSCHAC